MDDIGAFYRRFSPHTGIVIAFFCPFILAQSFLLSSTLTLYELLIGCHAFIYFSILTAFFVVYYGGRIENLSYSGSRKFAVI